MTEELTVTLTYKEAGEWVLRLNEKPSEDEVAEWLRWCEADPRNLQAFEEMNADWRGIVSLRQDAAFAIVKTPAGAGLQGPADAGRKRVSRRQFWKMAAVVACLSIAAGALLWNHDFGARHISAGTENRTTALPDGSLMTLRAQAAVKVSFAESERRLEIVKDGEAYFKVKKDASRPFIVRAGDVTIRAIGTAFDVKHDAERIRVVVEEGAVKVSTLTNHWMITAGQQFEYAQAGDRFALTSIEAERALRWRQGQFAYDKVPFAEVIQDINRYRERRIVIADPRIRAMPYTGTVFVNSIDDWIQALVLKYPVKAAATPDGDVALEPPESD